jgi:hypothetical protein
MATGFQRDKNFSVLKILQPFTLLFFDDRERRGSSARLIKNAKAFLGTSWIIPLVLSAFFSHSALFAETSPCPPALQSLADHFELNLEENFIDAEQASVSFDRGADHLVKDFDWIGTPDELQKFFSLLPQQFQEDSTFRTSFHDFIKEYGRIGLRRTFDRKELKVVRGQIVPGSAFYYHMKGGRPVLIVSEDFLKTSPQDGEIYKRKMRSIAHELKHFVYWKRKKDELWMKGEDFPEDMAWFDVLYPENLYESEMAAVEAERWASRILEEADMDLNYGNTYPASEAIRIAIASLTDEDFPPFGDRLDRLEDFVFKTLRQTIIRVITEEEFYDLSLENSENILERITSGSGGLGPFSRMQEKDKQLLRDFFDEALHSLRLEAQADRP